MTPELERRRFLSGGIAWLAAGQPRNVILMLADDLGYGDLGCYGSTTGATPHLDRIAAEGLRFTQHYSCSPVCSPARAGLMTGLAPDRTGVTGVLRDKDDHRGLALGLPTIASMLRNQGRRTALIGKWHLGMAGEYLPRRRGFDYFWGFLNGTIDYDTHLSKGGGATGSRTTYENEQPIALEGYFPDLATQKAVDYIEAHTTHPYFLYLPLALPHTPIQAPERWVKPFRGRVTEQQAVYQGMVRCMDHTVGEVRKALERTGQWDRTAFVFLSDHGWVKKRPPAEAGSNGALRGGKYELYEGGIRVPAIVRWPGLTRPGTITAALSWFPDWFPTLTGAPSVDGRDLTPVLRGRTPRGDRELCWRFQDSAVGTPLSHAIRRGKWKLIDVGGERRLYNVETDPGESRDLSGTQPAVVAGLEKRLERWRRSLSAPSAIP